MTTPNVDVDLYLPKTYIFERKGTAYATEAPMTQVGTGTAYVALPKGMSLVTVVATGMASGIVSVSLGVGGELKSDLLPWTLVSADTVRLWSGQLSAPSSSHLRLVVNARSITSTVQRTGSVSVQIVNFPPAN